MKISTKMNKKIEILLAFFLALNFKAFVNFVTNYVVLCCLIAPSSIANCQEKNIINNAITSIINEQKQSLTQSATSPSTAPLDTHLTSTIQLPPPPSNIIITTLENNNFMTHSYQNSYIKHASYNKQQKIQNLQQDTILNGIDIANYQKNKKANEGEKYCFLLEFNLEMESTPTIFNLQKKSEEEKESGKKDEKNNSDSNQEDTDNTDDEMNNENDEKNDSDDENAYDITTKNQPIDKGKNGCRIKLIQVQKDQDKTLYSMSMLLKFKYPYVNSNWNANNSLDQITLQNQQYFGQKIICEEKTNFKNSHEIKFTIKNHNIFSHYKFTPKSKTEIIFTIFFKKNVKCVQKSFSKKNIELIFILKNKKYVILIDPGHGGIEYGHANCKHNLLEKNINLKIAIELTNYILTCQPHEYEVILTRLSDVNISKFKRLEIIKTVMPDIILSIHSGYSSNQQECGMRFYNHDLKFFNSYQKGNCQSNCEQKKNPASNLFMEIFIEKLLQNEKICKKNKIGWREKGGKNLKINKESEKNKIINCKKLECLDNLHNYFCNPIIIRSDEKKESEEWNEKSANKNENEEEVSENDDANDAENNQESQNDEEKDGNLNEIITKKSNDIYKKIIPFILLEFGMMSNEDDIKRLSCSKYKHKMCKIVLNALNEFFLVQI